MSYSFSSRSKCLLISWLQSPSAVILEPKKIVCHCFHCFPIYFWHEVMGLDAMILVFWMLSFKPTFSFSSFTFIKRFLMCICVCVCVCVCVYTERERQRESLPWWLSGKESTCQCRRLGFNPQVKKIPCRRKWQFTLIFLPGKSHGQKSLAGYIPWGHKSWTWISN